MVALRRALGKFPGQVPQADRLVLPWLPSNPTMREERDEAAYYLVASLFASHQINWLGPEEYLGPTNFGASMRLLAKAVGGEGVERRFVGILNSDIAGLGLHLRHAVSILKSKSVMIDWAQLLVDICQWRNFNRGVQRSWARAFWGASPAVDEDKEEIEFRITHEERS